MKCFYFQDRHQRHLWTTLNTKFSFQVIEEKDYPPTANAGEDKVVYLPINQVTLHGNQSSDDHGIVSWEWTLNEGKVALASLSLEVILIFLLSSKQMHKITVLPSFQLVATVKKLIWRSSFLCWILGVVPFNTWLTVFPRIVSALE